MSDGAEGGAKPTGHFFRYEEPDPIVAAAGMAWRGVGLEVGGGARLAKPPDAGDSFPAPIPGETFP
jgi:hypothetical protein